MSRKKHKTTRKQSKPPRSGARVSVAIALVASMLAVVWLTLSSAPSKYDTRSATKLQPTETSLDNATTSELEALLAIPQALATAEDHAAFDSQRWTQSIDGSLSALQRDFPNDAQAEHLLGVAQMRLKRTKFAEPLLKHAIELAPHDRQMRIDYAELLMQLGRDEEALQMLEANTAGAVNAAIPSAWYELLAECHQRLGNLEAAQANLAQVVSANKQSAAAWIKLGKVHLQLIQAAEAEKCARQAIELNPEDVEAWQLLSRSLAIQKKSADSSQALQRLKELTARAGDADQKESFEYRQAQDSRRVLSSILRSLALLYQAKGKVPTAETLLAQAMQVNAQDTSALAAWAALARRQGDFDRAMQFNRQLISLQNQEPAHYQNLANLAMELNRPQDAEAALRLACLRMPGDGPTHLVLAQFLLLLRKPNAALPFARRANDLLKTQQAADLLAQVQQAATP